MKDCKIILRFTYRNHLDEFTDYKDEFVSIHDFKNYLKWMPERAMAIAYIPAVEETLKSSRSSNIRLSVLNRRKETVFENAHEFARFLRENAEVARAVQYSVRPRDQRSPDIAK